MIGLQRVKNAASTIFTWILAITLLQLTQFTQKQGEESLVETWLSVLIVGVLFGINFTLISNELRKRKQSINEMSYGGLILIYALIHMVSFAISMLIIIVILGLLDNSNKTSDLINEISVFIWSIDILKVYLYTYVISIGIFLVRIVNQKFGPGVLKGLILGRYRKPKEEKLMFLFMDLKSSTTYAEKLGHVKYSEMIQDCFSDLTKAVIDNHARIYQYVGDEVVLVWKYDEGVKNSFPIKLFFQFKETLQNKANYYQKNYGFIPEFKAGLNGGTLMAAEVGVVKRSIAYHGDVINIASRVQNLCNQLNNEFLITKNVVSDLPDILSIYYLFVDCKKLKGKQKMINIFGVHKLE